MVDDAVLILVRMRMWPNHLFKLFELFIKHVPAGSETVSKQSVETGLLDKQCSHLAIEIGNLYSPYKILTK